MNLRLAGLSLHFGPTAWVLLLAASAPLAQAQTIPEKQVKSDSSNQGGDPSSCESTAFTSPFISVDSWIYPAVLRLYSLGYLDHVYVGIRPWTWSSLSNMLDGIDANFAPEDEGPVAKEAREIVQALNSSVNRVLPASCTAGFAQIHLESTYTVVRGISGVPLRDSFHLGSTIINDYGRPYQNGMNNDSGASGYLTAGRFTLYLRGEFQGSPSAAGYGPALVKALSAVDETVNPVTGLPYSNQTIPAGPMGTVVRGKMIEAYVSTQILNHVVSFGKQDEWLGPAQGAGMAYSNNAENIYAFHINRIEPLYVPLLSRLTGPFRYEFLVGPLHGHTLMPNPLYANNPQTQPNVINPGHPWVHLEKISLRPTKDLEFGFERTALFGGEGHSPVTLGTFFKSFTSLTAPEFQVKNSRSDPGARFSAFDFSLRVPFLRNWLTLYSDAELHDGISPLGSPRHASWRPGLFLSHVPHLAALDIRAEAAYTDPPIRDSHDGRLMYWEWIEKQGYTSEGQMFGDWVGREGKGGQAWFTYHLSGNEWVQVGLRHHKTAKDFIPGGTTLNEVNFQTVKRIGKNLELNTSFALERWKAPIFGPGRQTVTAATVQLTWFPERTTSF